MAQVSSGSFTTNASSNRSLTFSWSVDSTSISGNYKKIKWSLVGSGSASGYVMSGDFKVVIDGETVYSSSTRIQLRNGTVVASGTKQLNHDATGNKKFSASVQASIYEYAVDNKGSGTWELPTIPRYATSVQSFNAKTETSITMNWSSDNTVDYIWYSSDNGSTWTSKNVTDGKSGSYTISGLKENTTYKIKTRVRRKDSQLTTDSSALSVTTYDYPYCTSTPDFIIGDAVTLKFYNPLSRAFDFYILDNKDESIGIKYTCSGTSYTGINSTSSSVPSLYKAIPNAKSTKYKVMVHSGVDVIKVTDNGNSFKVRGTEVPTLGLFGYTDDNANTKKITGNNQHIVQGLSDLTAVYNEAIPHESSGATISKYTFELNGVTKTSTEKGGSVVFGKINSSKNLTLTLTVTDSRGLTASATKEVIMLPYSNPTALVTLERLNNYEDESYLTVDGSVSSVNSKNTMEIKYRYKEQGGSYNSFVTVGDKAKQTIPNLDKNKVFIFNVVVTDAFGKTYNKEHTLGKGVFPLFIDTKLNSIGINKLPTEPNALEIEGRILGTQNQVLWEGASLVPDTVPINLSEPISKQPNGIVLVFSYYNSSTSLGESWMFHTFFVSKYEVALNDGKGHSFPMSHGNFNTVGCKYLYIANQQITGNPMNTTSGTGSSGIKYDNNCFCLRYVLGV